MTVYTQHTRDEGVEQGCEAAYPLLFPLEGPVALAPLALLLLLVRVVALLLLLLLVARLGLVVVATVRLVPLLLLCRRGWRLLRRRPLAEVLRDERADEGVGPQLARHAKAGHGRDDGLAL